MTGTAFNGAVETLANSSIDRSLEDFMGSALRNIAGALQDVVGVEDAKAFVSIAGMEIGDRWNKEYREALGVSRLSREEVAAALVDLKARIKGDFRVESIDETRIVLVNSACPFGAHVEGRPAMCQMTSSVFGRIVADNLGFARVRTVQAIARGDPWCRVVIDLCDAGAAPAGADEFYGEDTL